MSLTQQTMKMIIIVHYPFTERDYNRLGIDIFKKHNFNVVVWNFGLLIREDIYSEIIEKDMDCDLIKIPKSIEEAKTWMMNIDVEKSWVFILYHQSLPLWVNKTLSKKNTRTFIIANLAVPSVSGKRVIEKIKAITIKKLMNVCISRVKKKCHNLIIYLGRIKPYTIVFGGGALSIKQYEGNVLISSKSIRKYFHQLDYDNIILDRKYKDIELPAKFFVFLDSNEVFDQHYLILNKENPLTSDVYYPRLNKFFDYIEKEYQIEVVIAAHPRSQYEDKPDYFNGRKVYKGMTHALIKDSEFVLLHSSTATNYIICYNKPCAFILMPEFSNLTKSLMRGYINWFQKKPVMLLKDQNRYEPLDKSINAEVYKVYKDDWIKCPGSPERLFWELVIEELLNY
jgi:hypothetical protein